MGDNPPTIYIVIIEVTRHLPMPRGQSLSVARTAAAATAASATRALRLSCRQIIYAGGHTQLVAQRLQWRRAPPHGLRTPPAARDATRST